MDKQTKKDMLTTAAGTMAGSAAGTVAGNVAWEALNTPAETAANEGQELPVLHVEVPVNNDDYTNSMEEPISVVYGAPDIISEEDDILIDNPADDPFVTMYGPPADDTMFIDNTPDMYGPLPEVYE